MGMKIDPFSNHCPRPNNNMGTKSRTRTYPHLRNNVYTDSQKHPLSKNDPST